MQIKFIYFAITALTLYCSCQNANARGYINSQNQTTDIVEEIPAVKKSADSAPSSGVWDETKEITSDVWSGTKEVTSDVWDGTKKVSSDVWDGAKEVGGDIKNAISDK